MTGVSAGHLMLHILKFQGLYQKNIFDTASLFIYYYYF